MLSTSSCLQLILAFKAEILKLKQTYLFFQAQVFLRQLVDLALHGVQLSLLLQAALQGALAVLQQPLLALPELRVAVLLVDLKHATAL